MARHIGTDLYDTFIAVADTGGFTAAVDRLNRTQTTISQQIKRLETLVGTELFIRTNRNVELTPAGQALLPYARRILLLNEQAAQAVSATGHGSIRIGVPDIYAETVVPCLIELLRAWDSQAAPRVCCNHSTELLGHFSSGDLDIVLAGRCSDFAIGRSVSSEPLVWVGSPEFRPCGERRLPLILPSEGCSFRASALEALDRAGVPWEAIHTGENPAAINPSLFQGFGITAMPGRMMPAGLEDVGERLALPQIKAASVDIHVNPALERNYGEAFKPALLEAAMNAFTNDRHAHQVVVDGLPQWLSRHDVTPSP